MCDDFDSVTYEGEPDDLLVVLGREVGLVVLEGVADRAPEGHRVHLVLLGARVGVLLHHVRDHAGHVDAVGQRDGHGDDGEDGEGEGHDAHHHPAHPEVDAAAAALEADHLEVETSDGLSKVKRDQNKRRGGYHGG